MAPGQRFGFLGANGAGKTTTLSVLVGRVRPNSGTAFVAGAAAGTAPGSLAYLSRLNGNRLTHSGCLAAVTHWLVVCVGFANGSCYSLMAVFNPCYVSKVRGHERMLCGNDSSRLHVTALPLLLLCTTMNTDLRDV